MNGWLRLWVLVSVVWAVLVVSVAAIIIPEVAAPEVAFAMSPKEAEAAMDKAMSLYDADPEGPQAQQYLSDAALFADIILNPFKAEKPALANRGRFYVQSLAWLAIPPLILLLLGYGFAWVLRGFGSNR